MRLEISRHIFLGCDEKPLRPFVCMNEGSKCFASPWFRLDQLESAEFQWDNLGSRESWHIWAISTCKETQRPKGLSLKTVWLSLPLVGSLRPSVVVHSTVPGTTRSGDLLEDLEATSMWSHKMVGPELMAVIHFQLDEAGSIEPWLLGRGF